MILRKNWQSVSGMKTFLYSLGGILPILGVSKSENREWEHTDIPLLASSLS